MDRYLFAFGLAASIAAATVAGYAARVAQTESPPPILASGGFESGLSSPWGTCLYPEFHPQAKSIWFNHGKCRSWAEADRETRFSGKTSLHVVNPGPLAPGDYGMTTQTIKVVPNQRYRVLLWARAKNLASDKAVWVHYEAGRACSLPLVRLDKGTYDWTPFTGTFVCNEPQADFCIVSAGTGEVWIDDIVIEPEPGVVAAKPSAPRGRP